MPHRASSQARSHSSGIAAAPINRVVALDPFLPWQHLARGEVLLAADLFHQHLLQGLGCKARLATAWLSPTEWTQELCGGAVDAVLIQEVTRGTVTPTQRHEPEQLPVAVARLPLGCRPLVLACHGGAAGANGNNTSALRLLAPPRAAAADLHQALQGLQLAPVQQCSSTDPLQWITLLEQGASLLPIPAELLRHSPWHEAALTAVPPWEPLWEQLDLLVPSALLECPVVQELTQTLRQRMAEKTTRWLD